MDNVQNNMCRRMFTIIIALNDINTYSMQSHNLNKKLDIYIYPLSVQTHVPQKEVECLLALWNHLLLVHHPLEEQEGQVQHKLVGVGIRNMSLSCNVQSAIGSEIWLMLTVLEIWSLRRFKVISLKTCAGSTLMELSYVFKQNFTS